MKYPKPIHASPVPYQSICIFHCYAESSFGVFVRVIVKNGKTALSQVSVNTSSDQFFELSATELKAITCG